MPTASRRVTNPYKFLAPYERGDAGIFFGRETEIEVLLSDIISTRLILLFAKTGSGKTSLIKAGVIPRLVELDYKPIYVRVEQDPLDSIHDELTRQRLLSVKKESATLEAQLRHVVTTKKKPVVLFCDQFEEFFIYVSDEARRQEFISTVARLYHDRESAVHFVFSFREEFFVEMGAFRDQIPSIFHNNSNLRLEWFDLEQAQDALIKPALKYDAKVEPLLVSAVLTDLGEARGIEPAQLQIVCHTLWREKEKMRNDTLLYAVYDRLGRAQGILERRLVEDIDNNLDDAQLQLFERMLPELRTRLGARTEYTFMRGQVFNEVLKPLKRGRTLDDLRKALWLTDEHEPHANSKDDGVIERDALIGLIEKLKTLHLLKEVERYDDIYYEWTSDYLADLTDSLHERVRAMNVRRTLDAAIARARKEQAEFGEFGLDAEQLLAQSLIEDTLEALYMSATDFEAVTEKARLLSKLTLEQVRFLFSAALEHGTHMSLWFDRTKAIAGDEQTWQLIRDRISNERVRIEQAWHTIELLGELGLRESEGKNALRYLKLALQQEGLALPAVHALSRMRNREAISILATALDEGRLADQIIDRLGEIRTTASVEVLAQSLERRELSARAEQVLESISKGRAGSVASLASSLLQTWRDKKKQQGQGAPDQVIERGFERMDWDALLYSIKYKQCTPILGPGILAGLAPLKSEIARVWASEYDYPFEDSSNLARVAQFLSVTQDWVFAKEKLARLLKGSLSGINLADTPHAILASLSLPVYITTAYDDILLEALRQDGKDPRTEVCRWHKVMRHSLSKREPDYTGHPIPTPSSPLVYHLYGHMNEPESIVLTEDDYIDFAAAVFRYEILPPAVLGALGDKSTYLIIGHSVDDWSFRLLFNGFIKPSAHRSSRYSSICQLSSGLNDYSGIYRNVQLHYYEQYLGRNGIKVYWGTVERFLSELRHNLSEGFPRYS